MFVHTQRATGNTEPNRTSISSTYLAEPVCIYLGKEDHFRECEEVFQSNALKAERFREKDVALQRLAKVTSYQPVLTVVEYGSEAGAEIEEVLKLLRTSLFYKVMVLVNSKVSPTAGLLKTSPQLQNPCTPIKTYFLPKALPQLKWELADFLVDAQHFSTSTERLLRFSSLNDREYRVARYVARGLPNKQICKLIDVSEKTIEKCRKELYEKLGVHSGPELASLVTFWNSYRWPESVAYPKR
jgi:DNA-binding CsgD family transcriptional regulator